MSDSQQVEPKRLLLPSTLLSSSLFGLVVSGLWASSFVIFCWSISDQKLLKHHPQAQHTYPPVWTNHPLRRESFWQGTQKIECWGLYSAWRFEGWCPCCRTPPEVPHVWIASWSLSTIHSIASKCSTRCLYFAFDVQNISSGWKMPQKHHETNWWSSKRWWNHDKA